MLFRSAILFFGGMVKHIISAGSASGILEYLSGKPMAASMAASSWTLRPLSCACAEFVIPTVAVARDTGYYCIVRGSCTKYSNNLEEMANPIGNKLVHMHTNELPSYLLPDFSIQRVEVR